MPANEVVSLHTKEGKLKAGNQYSLNLFLEVKFEEKRKFRKLKKYVVSLNILHLHFELQTEVKKKLLKPQVDAFSQMMKKSKKKLRCFTRKKNDSEGLRNIVRNYIIDLTREKEGGFSVNSCEWKNPNNKNSSSKGAGIEYIDVLTTLCHQLVGQTSKGLNFPPQLRERKGTINNVPKKYQFEKIYFAKY